MATRKQRRRREKELRHDYEVVYLDDEGHEVEPEEVEPRAPARRSSTANGRGKGGRSARGAGTPSRGRRTPQPPSWRRVLKRGALFFPLFVGVLLLVGGKHMSPAGAILQGLMLFVFFVPFSYFLDSWLWRSYQKKGGGTPLRR